MTTYNKTTLKTFFEDGDVPAGTNYSDFIDSCVNTVETAVQSLSGPFYATEVISPTVSALNVTATGTLTAHAVSTDTMTSPAVISTTVSAVTLYANTGRIRNGVIGETPTIVSAAGTSQATGALFSTYITRGQGTTDGSETGYLLAAPSIGWTQYFMHEGAVSANLWPSSGCKINGLASNAAFGMAANTMYTIVHITASAYAVK